MIETQGTDKPPPAHGNEHATTRSVLFSSWQDAAQPPTPHSFQPGDRLAGRYTIERLLGRGGMGDVYEARDEDLAIPVALKTLHWDVGREHEVVRCLKREVLLARAVGHPNVCRVYDLGRHGKAVGGQWFLTMELLRGETLAERLRQPGRLSAEEMLPLVEQMGAGLGAAHRAGVVHRDFKSGNVMLVRGTAGERAVVTDFGVASAAAGSTIAVEKDRTQPIVGTPAYMAPEQVRGEEVGPAADIYALGVVLYEMVTGRLPFEGRTAIEVAKQRLSQAAPSPRIVVKEVDDRWEAVILRCLAQKPGDRFGQAEEVAAALQGQTPVAAVGALGAPLRIGHTLPAEPDAFVGRERELEELHGSLRKGSGVVTLVGAAGMGKTRLAIRCGWRSVREWPGGVWFSSLAEANSREGITSAVAGSLGVPLGGGDAVEHLGHAIAGRGRCLVILDNFDQVVAHAAETLGRWLERAADARFLITSRERLNLRGEEVQAVGPLTPDSGVELFAERARRQRPGLELEGSELEAAREVVRLVEGMPLAIELAATRMRVLTGAQLVERMRERFQVLAAGTSGRHATLRAAIDGSWELLRPWEKAAFAQCAVFEGGFTLESVEGVLNLTSWSEAPWVVDVVQSLVDKSLLRMWAEGEGGARVPEPRLGMYVSLQEYARKKLEEEGAIPEEASGAQAARAAEERHGRWYARSGRVEAIEALAGHGGKVLRRALGRELENLMTACRRAVVRREGATAVATYRAAWAVLDLRGPYGTAVELGRKVLGLPLERGDQAFALITLGQAEWRCGRMEEAHAHFEAALQIHHEMGDRRSEGVVLGELGNVRREQGRMEEALGQYEAALEIHREMGDRQGEGVVLTNLGILHSMHGQMVEAHAHLEAALEIHREMGNRRGEGVVLSNLGILHSIHGRMEEALAHIEAVLDIHREVGNRRAEGTALGDLGNVHLAQGRFEASLAQYEAALEIHRQVGNRRDEGVALGNLGCLHREQGRMEDAQACFEAALEIHREVGHRRMEGIVLSYLGRLHLLQHRMKEARETLVQAEAQLRAVSDWIELGILLCARAELEHRSGDVAAARALLGEAESLFARGGAGPDSPPGRELARVRQALAAPPEAPPS